MPRRRRGGPGPGRPDVTDAAGFARAATEGLGLQVEVRVEDAGWEVPDEVAAAMTGAVREALRNVQRHAGVAEARLDVRASGRGLDVTVTDHGRGLAPGAEEGFGLRRSVREPLADVGGEVEISGPVVL